MNARRTRELPQRLPRRRRTLRPRRGLTIIELMISITIGLVIVAAIGYLYLNARGSYRVNSSLAHIQEAGRFGLDAVLRDARSVGDVGCGSRMSISTGLRLAVTNVAAFNLPGDNGIAQAFSGPDSAIFGVSASGYQFTPAPFNSFVLPAAAQAAAPAWVGGDVLEMVVPTSAPAPLLADPVNATITIRDNAAGLRAGDFVVVSNCTAALLAALVANPAVGANSAQLTLNLAGAAPGALLPFAFATRPSVQRVDAVTYYVGQVRGRWPALYRFSATYNVVEEVIDHVENMSVAYGVGNAPPVPATGATPWAAVTSVRVSLQVVGDEYGVAEGQVVSLAPPAGFPAPDSRLRQVFTGTAALRERI
jgi:type IV pilus assembly protein PilW